MEQKKPSHYDRVVANLNAAKSIFNDNFNKYAEDSPDAVIAIAQMLQIEQGLDLQRQGMDLQVQGVESSLKMNATTTALAEAQIQWLDKQEVERGDIDSLATVGPTSDYKDITVNGSQLSAPNWHSYPQYKTVVVRGESFTVPNWVKYVAMNRDGSVWGFEVEPNKLDWEWSASGRRDLHLGCLSADYDGWYETLQKVDSGLLTTVGMTPDYKHVSYHGQEFEIPDWAEYITYDANRRVMVWEHKPQKGDIVHRWLLNKDSTNAKEVGRIETLENADLWESSLRELD